LIVNPSHTEVVMSVTVQEPIKKTIPTIAHAAERSTVATN
jgi:hypothetical protein